MLNDQSFLKAIVENPADDGPRLLYADYLEEKGDPGSASRAEFIRVQCALAVPEGSDNLAVSLRATELLESHWREWLRPICQALGEPLPTSQSQPERRTQAVRYDLNWNDDPDRPNNTIQQSRPDLEMPFLHSARFARGFVNQLALVGKSFRGPLHIGRLAERTPIDHISFVNFTPPALLEAVSALNADNLRGLELAYLQADCLEALLSRTALHNLETLALFGLSGSADLIQSVCQSHRLPNLRRLILRWTDQVDNLALSDLCKSPLAGRLEYLHLSETGADGVGVTALAKQADLFPNLKCLEVYERDVDSTVMTRLREAFPGILSDRRDRLDWPLLMTA